MPIGIVQSTDAALKDRLRKDCKAHTICKHDSETYISPRDTAVLDLFTLDGTVSAKEYEIAVESKSPVEFTLSADLNAADLTFTIIGDGNAYLSTNDYLEVGAEKMVVSTVVANGNDFDVTVYARGHGTSIAAAHVAADDSVVKIGRVENFCEATGACEVFVNEGKIVNSVQRHSHCVAWCDEDLCAMIKEDPDCDRDRFIQNYKDEAAVKSAAKNVKFLNSMALKGVYQSWDNADGTAGSSAGLMEYANGITTSTGNTISGIKFDAQDVADNGCFDGTDATTTAATSALSYDLLSKLFDKVYLAEGNLTHVLINPADQIALKDFIKPCQSNPCGSTGGDVAFANVNVIPGTPFGDIIVQPSNDMKKGEMLFVNQGNLKMYAYCYNRGELFQTKAPYETTNGSGNWKQDITGHFAFDASQNMCTDIALLSNYTIPAC